MGNHDSPELPEIHEGGYGSPTVEEEMPDPAEESQDSKGSADPASGSSAGATTD